MVFILQWGVEFSLLRLQFDVEKGKIYANRDYDHDSCGTSLSLLSSPHFSRLNTSHRQKLVSSGDDCQQWIQMKLTRPYMEAHIRDEITHIIAPAAEIDIHQAAQARKPAHTSTCTLASTLAHARFYNSTKAIEEKPYLFCKGMLKNLDNDNRHVVP